MINPKKCGVCVFLSYIVFVLLLALQNENLFRKEIELETKRVFQLFSGLKRVSGNASVTVPCSFKNIPATAFLSGEFTVPDNCSQRNFYYELVYDSFNFTEPLFVSDEDRKRFLGWPVNLKFLGPQPKEKLRGIIQAIPNGAVDRYIDCGWPSNLKEFEWTGNKIALDRAAPLLVPDSASFQHFLDGVLPKLVQSYNVIKSAKSKLLIFEPRDAIVLEMLEKLNIKMDDLIYYNDTTSAKLQINSCVTPPLHPLLWNQIRSALGAPRSLKVPIHQSNVVLLTRAQSYNAGRNMLNFEEVKNFLINRYSSRLIIFEGNYGLKRSVQIFGRSSILIGVHGGALYNLNFAPSDAHIVEFLPMTDFATPKGHIAHAIVWHMAQLLGQTYWRIFQTTDTPDGDIFVSMEKLRTVLDRIDLRLNSNPL